MLKFFGFVTIKKKNVSSQKLLVSPRISKILFSTQIFLVAIFKVLELFSSTYFPIDMGGDAIAF